MKPNVNNGARTVKPMSPKQRTYAILSLLMLGFDKFEVKARQNAKDGFNMTYEFSQLKRRDNVLNETPVFFFNHGQSEASLMMAMRAMFELASRNAIQKGKVNLKDGYNKEVADIVKYEVTSDVKHSIEDIYEALKIAQEVNAISKDQFVTQQANFVKKISNAKNIYDLDSDVIEDFANHMITGAHYTQKNGSGRAVKNKITQIQ